MHNDPNNYSFCKFRIPEGKRVIWEITNECNYGCKYCIFASTGRKPVGELDTQEVYGLLAQLKAQGFTHVKFTGGEPFLRPDMIAILQKTDELGFCYDISTNASRIKPIMVEQLSELKMEMIHISLDGHTKEIHEAVRGKKSFEPTLAGLGLLTGKQKIRVGCVIHLHNENYLREMIEFCERLKVDELIFSLMEPVGRLRGKDTHLAQRKRQELLEEIESYRSSIKVSHNLHAVVPNTKMSQNHCPGGDKFLFINSLGDVSPCTWVSEKRPDLIIHHVKTLSEALSGIEKFRQVAKKMPCVCPMENLKEFNEQGI